jgi:bilirubin oxidase
MKVGQYKDYYYPNSESGRTIWYHDHADGHTAADAYYGQAGVYIIHDPAEDALGLPSGNYDVPLALTDKIYQSNGDLASPTGNTMNFFGDVIEVNAQPWPYLSVEPRKYRFRIFDMSLSRPYDLYFEDPSGNWIDFQVIASDSGLFGTPVTTNDLVIAMGERYEVVVDFSSYAGKNISLNNNMQQQQINEYDNTDQVMRFVVGNSVSDSSNNGAVPSTLNGNIQWPAERTTVDHTFNFQMGGEAMWTINGVDFSDVNNRILARPPQGTVELWELHHTGGPAVHPVHIHLVNLQVVSRTGGSRGVLPYEAAGLKDTVLLEPGETVQVRAFYGPWNGVYVFHCHNLVHEDNAMMDAFNTTLVESLGYDFNSTFAFSDPMAEQFTAQDYSDEAYQPSALTSAVLSLASLAPYPLASSLMAAENSYYATAGYNGDSSKVSQTTTVAASSSGYGFASTTATASTLAVAGSVVGKAKHFTTPTPTPQPTHHSARAFTA